MAVIDAPVFVDALVSEGRVGIAARAELAETTELHVPAIFGAEVTSALSQLVRRRGLASARARAALAQVRVVRSVTYPFEPFVDRAWELRDNVTVYDAWYVALAEWLDTELITADRRLVDAPGPRCRIRLVGGR